MFANAFIGCYQARLMKRQDLVRLANLGDLDAAQNALAEYGYSDPADTKEKGDVESYIRKEHAHLYELVFRNVTGREELAPYLYPMDYHNIKVCLKSEILGKQPEDEMLYDTGDIDWTTMVSLVRDRNYAAMRPVMRDALQEAADIYGRTGDPQAIDLVLDKACYKDMILTAEETGSEFIVELIRTMIDTVNLKTFARVRRAGKGWAFFKSTFIPEGFLTENFFVSNFDDPMSQLADKIIQKDISAAVREGGRILEETGRFTQYEKMLDDAVMNVNRKSRTYITGLEPLAGYWYAKKTEIENVRIILNGLMAHTASDVIIEFLREPY